MKKYTILEIADLIENYSAMRCVGSSGDYILKEVGKALRKGWVECFSCNGTGKSINQGFWGSDYSNNKKSVWIEVDNLDGTCPRCEGTGKAIITVEKLESLRGGI